MDTTSGERLVHVQEGLVLRPALVQAHKEDAVQELLWSGKCPYVAVKAQRGRIQPRKRFPTSDVRRPVLPATEAGARGYKLDAGSAHHVTPALLLRLSVGLLAAELPKQCSGDQGSGGVWNSLPRPETEVSDLAAGP
jgi:hypothetical protein